MVDKDRTLASPNPPGGEPGAVLVETERLLIRRYVLADAPRLAAAADHASIGDGLRDRFPSPYTLADAEDFLAQHNDTVESRYPVHAAIFVKAAAAGHRQTQDLQYIGAMGVVPGDDVEYRTWELGYWLTPTAWGRGYMTEAVRGFTRWAFATWPALHRIEATPFAHNAQSCALLRKCGFVEEGRRRGAAEKNGVVVDIVVFGLLRSDVEAETRQ
ncbi:acetyltransferase (GNAT) domain-containing protein [Purpureocillium lavendulum]|uniref:Acetyltransferase (GNAT) domain-containing protein n=1 Tax=Purpureocillium lavendulum TaxID=1247861 RepID=A0AB34FNK4_9HYPO|nr:acetyltransferase (GNAT) domain-containing protein [Purpureocillium lavendulum]